MEGSLRMGFGDSHAASGGSIYHGNFTGAHFHVGDQRKDEFHEKLGVSPAMFPCYELPAKREHYIGRDNERTVIQNHLQSYRKSGSISYISIFGLGGVGKSAFALDYAWRCQAAKTYDAIFWIHAETPISTRESFASIALSLGMVISSDNPDLNVFMVKKWLEKTDKRWLLIFDNVEAADWIANVPPIGGGHVMITCRYRSIALKCGDPKIMLELISLDDSEARALFFEMLRKYGQGSNRAVITSKDEEQATNALLTEVGGLPLGIEQMAATIQADQATVRQFLDRYRRTPRVALKRNNIGVGTEHTLDTLWSISFQRIKSSHPDTHRLLAMLSMVGPDDIPISMFMPDDESELETILTPYSEFCGDEERCEDGFGQLTGIALARRVNDRLALHRLTQEAFFCSLEQNEVQQAFDSLAKLINNSFPKQVNARPLVDQWAECRVALPHAMALANVFTRAAARRRASRLRSCVELQELMKNCVWYLYERGDLQEGLKLITQAFEMFPERNNSLIYAHLCNSAFVIHYDLNDLRSCEDALKTSLEIRQKLLPSDDLELATAYGNWATLLATQGNHSEASKFFELSQSSRDHSDEEHRLANAVFESSFGWALRRKGEHDLARERYRKAESVYSDYSDIDILTAFLLHEYGSLELACGDFERALTNLEKGLDLVKESSPWHLLTATLHYKIAVVETLLKHFENAVDNVDRAIDIARLTKSMGIEARSLRQKAAIINLNPSATANELADADLADAKAEEIKGMLETHLGLDSTTHSSDKLTKDNEYEALVPGFYR